MGFLRALLTVCLWADKVKLEGVDMDFMDSLDLLCMRTQTKLNLDYFLEMPKLKRNET